MKTSNFKLIAMLLLVLAVFSVFALTGCNGPQVSDIYVAKSGMPKLVYVQGQEFDVSGGVLTVVTDGEESSIPMNSEGVSISGYDKEKLGKQTVTVTYMEKTVNLEVNVIARMVAESYEENYFVGDSFNANKGKIRLARDNGTTFNVNLNDKGVEIVSFDSSKAGTTAVAVK